MAKLILRYNSVNKMRGKTVLKQRNMNFSNESDVFNASTLQPSKREHAGLTPGLTAIAVIAGLAIFVFCVYAIR